MQVTRRFEFDSAHQLSERFGKCHNPHGHRYTLEVTLEGPVVDGIVMDISELKKIVNDSVVDKLDHQNINDYIKEPTAENIALWMWQQLKDKLPLLSQIRLYETPSNSVTYKGK